MLNKDVSGAPIDPVDGPAEPVRVVDRAQGVVRPHVVGVVSTILCVGVEAVDLPFDVERSRVDDHERARLGLIVGLLAGHPLELGVHPDLANARDRRIEPIAGAKDVPLRQLVLIGGGDAGERGDNVLNGQSAQSPWGLEHVRL
jgi:hypothetical protein